MKSGREGQRIVREKVCEGGMGEKVRETTFEVYTLRTLNEQK